MELGTSLYKLTNVTDKPLRGNITKLGWELPEDLTQEEWVDYGRTLASVEGCLYWLIGDWWAFGEHKYGARKELTMTQDWEGPSFQSCANAAWVSRKIETSRRREVLPWSLHSEVAALEPHEQDRLLDKAVSECLSQRDLRTKARLAKAERVHRETQALPNKQYQVIYADPPWQYSNERPEGTTRPEDHYPVMSLEEIMALPIRDITLPDAVLFLWAPSPLLPEALRVMESWGFEYKSSFVWDKVKHNMGYYNSVRHEFLLVSGRGSSTPDKRQLFDSVYSEERAGHSIKPEFFYTVIETLYIGTKIELFSRQERSGWDRWGNEQ